MQGRNGWMPLALLSLLSLAAWPARAEVGISSGGSQSQTRALYILQTVIDDTEPVGVWIPYHNSTEFHFGLNPTGDANGDGKPSILLDPSSGLAVAAWSRHGAAGYDVVLSHSTGGAWSEPQVLAGFPANALDPFLLQSPVDGTIHLLYWIQDTAPRIMHRQAPADLSSWSPAVQVSQVGEIACRPSAVFHQSVLTVAYESHDLGYGLTPRRIVVATPDGQGFQETTVATTQQIGANWPEVHSRNGRLWVDWIDINSNMSWRRMSEPGIWDPAAGEAYTGVEDRDFHVRGRIKAQAVE